MYKSFSAIEQSPASLQLGVFAVPKWPIGRPNRLPQSMGDRWSEVCFASRAHFRAGWFPTIEPARAIYASADGRGFTFA
jgi:hypothetical protein